LLQKDPAKRLGTKGGLKEVLAHPWFDCLDKDKIVKKLVEAPMKPVLSKDVLDT
jgi:serum/glucocorticoid-regulated kinase 2